MTTRYCGIGGNDGNSGLTWALRKLTLNGVEDTPVVAGDVCYVGPGCYREMLTLDVTGNVGNRITYIGDVTGEHTDQVGGIVRLTGSDNDQATARNHCVDNDPSDCNYRTFRGFRFDFTAEELIAGGDSHHNTVEDSALLNYSSVNRGLIYVNGGNQSDWIIRRCMLLAYQMRGIYFNHWGDVAAADHLVENCLFIYCENNAVDANHMGGCVVRNSLFLSGATHGIYCGNKPAAGTALTVNNCILQGLRVAGVGAGALGDLVEDFNAFAGNSADRTNVNVGANSETYPALVSLPMLYSGASQISGFKFPWWFGELSKWSQVRAITGTNEPTEDMRGLARPATASKNSWGGVQFCDAERETGTKHAGSASICLHDAGRHQIWIPATNLSTTISVYVYREANYAGNNPQMIIKQPGQTDDVTTDAAAASQWNLLTTTLTPAADPPYVVVELVSRNTAAAGNYDVFFDDIKVS